MSRIDELLNELKNEIGRASRRRCIPRAVRDQVFLRDGRACLACGARSDLQIDHVNPVSLGGSDDPDNLQTLCGSCNRAKSNSSSASFIPASSLVIDVPRLPPSGYIDALKRVLLTYPGSVPVELRWNERRILVGREFWVSDPVTVRTEAEGLVPSDRA